MDLELARACKVSDERYAHDALAAHLGATYAECLMYKFTEEWNAPTPALRVAGSARVFAPDDEAHACDGGARPCRAARASESVRPDDQRHSHCATRTSARDGCGLGRMDRVALMALTEGEGLGTDHTRGERTLRTPTETAECDDRAICWRGRSFMPLVVPAMRSLRIWSA